MIHKIFQLVAFSEHCNRCAALLLPFTFAALFNAFSNVVSNNVSSTDEGIEEVVHEFNSDSFKDTSIGKLDGICFFVSDDLITLADVDFVLGGWFRVVELLFAVIALGIR